MSASNKIKAEVIDIRRYTPRQGDRFFVDTNVWCWYAYTKATINLDQSRIDKIDQYLSFISTAYSMKAVLYRSGLSFSEMANLIEEKERDIFKESNGIKGKLHLKKYRHAYPNERKSVVNEIITAWNEVEIISQLANITIDQSNVDDALMRLRSQNLDIYDFFLVGTMTKNKIFNVITDDYDFTSVPGIRVFTANENAINDARREQKLKKS